jgi:CHAT domain-containing protein/tetratricopeptide (TPR) repeat protein
MSLDRDDEQHLKSYLLGELAQEEMRELEERLLREEEFANQVLLIEDELIEDYMLGELSSKERQQFEKYFLTTPRRRRKLMMVEGLRERASVRDPRAIVEGPGEQTTPATKVSKVRMIEEPTWWTRLFQPPWKIAGFAALILVAGLGVWRAFLYQSPVERGLTALNVAYKQQRPLEARVIGMSYAPHSGKRGGDAENVDYRARDLSRSLLLGAASDNPNASTLHALGRSYLMQKEFDKAILEFQEALKSSSNNAQLHADLGAALLEQAKLLRDRDEDGKAMEKLAESQQHLNTALRSEPSLLEAMFNKALVLEELKLPEQAREAWQKYLELDPQSKWSKEAQRRLQSISEQRRLPLTPDELLANFLAAFRERNDTEAWRLLSANREVITGKMIPLRLAHDYVAHTLKGEDSKAREKLDALVFAGQLDQRKGGDSYTKELAGYYANSSRATLHLLSKAAEDINQGYALCLATKYEEASERFTSARAAFDRAGDEWEARLANYWIAYCLSQPGAARESNVILKSLAEFCQKRGYKWLLALATGWLGSNHTALHEYSNAIKYNRQSLALAEEISDTYQMQRALMSLGELYARLRQPEASLGYHYRNLVLASSSGATPRQAWRNLTYFGGAFFTFKHYDAAAALINEALRRAVTEFDDPSLLYLQHLNLAQIYSKLREFDAANAQAEIGLNIAYSVQDPKSRLKPVANATLRQADIWREAGQCDKAIANYDQAIALYEEINLDLYRYAAYKGRLLCNRVRSDDTAVGRDLTTLLALFEKQRTQIREEENRNRFFDAEQGVYDIAVEYEYEKQNYLAALNHAEAAHGRSLLDAVQSGVRIEITSAGPEMAFGQVSNPADLENIRQHMPLRLHVLMYTVLPTKLLIWSISHNGFSVVQKEVTADALGTEVNSYVNAMTKELSGPATSTTALATKLYDTLLGPVVKTIKSGDVVCIIPDKFLHRLPFAALISPDSGRYLVEDRAIFYAPSLNVLWHCSTAGRTKAPSGRGTVLSIGNPYFDFKAHPDLQPLREPEREARTVAELYHPSSLVLGPRASKARIIREMDSAEIIHFAGHYVVDEASPLLSKMLLASREKNSDAENSDRDLAAFEIVRQQLDHTGLVILSACQTGLDKYYESEGAVGLARAFIAAGVPLVVASQWPVDSNATANLMISFHRYRRSGLDTSESLRKAQADMLRGSDEAYRSPYYWAAFLCAGGYVEY